MSALIRVGTLNLRNTSDRWPERYRLLAEQLAELGPDVIGLQELRRPSLQRWQILRAARRAQREAGRRPRLVAAWKTGTRRWKEGVAVLTDLPVVEHAWLDLRVGQRVAQRVTVALPGGELVRVYNTHLHHEDPEPDARLRQVERLLAWMRRHAGDPQVLVGDLNAPPDDPAIVRLRARLRSAYAEVHGAEPEQTVPAPVHQRWGQEAGSVIDYILVNERLRVHDAWLTFDRVADDDDRLSASDHYGLAATLSIRSL